MDEESVRPPIPPGGFISGNETVYGYSECELGVSDIEFVRATSGW